MRCGNGRWRFLHIIQLQMRSGWRFCRGDWEGRELTRFCTNSSTGFDRFCSSLMPSLINKADFFSSFVAAEQTEAIEGVIRSTPVGLKSYLHRYSNRMLWTTDFLLSICKMDYQGERWNEQREIQTIVLGEVKESAVEIPHHQIAESNVIDQDLF